MDPLGFPQLQQTQSCGKGDTPRLLLVVIDSVSVVDITQSSCVYRGVSLTV